VVKIIRPSAIYGAKYTLTVDEKVKHNFSCWWTINSYFIRNFSSGYTEKSKLQSSSVYATDTNCNKICLYSKSILKTTEKNYLSSIKIVDTVLLGHTTFTKHNTLCYSN